MQLRDMYKSDINRDINGVIKSHKMMNIPSFRNCRNM